MGVWVEARQLAGGVSGVHTFLDPPPPPPPPRNQKRPPNQWDRRRVKIVQNNMVMVVLIMSMRFQQIEDFNFPIFSWGAWPPTSLIALFLPHLHGLSYQHKLFGNWSQFLRYAPPLENPGYRPGVFSEFFWHATENQREGAKPTG